MMEGKGKRLRKFSGIMALAMFVWAIPLMAGAAEIDTAAGIGTMAGIDAGEWAVVEESTAVTEEDAASEGESTSMGDAISAGNQNVAVEEATGEDERASKEGTSEHLTTAEDYNAFLDESASAEITVSAEHNVNGGELGSEDMSKEGLSEDDADMLAEYANDMIASGTSNNVTWLIDTAGKLIVSGTGDCQMNNQSPWHSYHEQIISAEIRVINMENASYLFADCNNLVSVDVNMFDTKTITDMSSMFYQCSSLTNIDVSNWDTSNVTNMGRMFSDCNSLDSLDVSNWNTSNVTNMEGMFSNCNNLAGLDVSNWNTANVGYDMSGMYSGCGHPSQNISNGPAGVIRHFCMSGMFSGCSSLTSLDVSNFNTSKVYSMDGMFSGCSALTSLDLSYFDTSNITNMEAMFSGCSGLTNLDLSNFDTSNVTNMEEMFSGCSSLANLDLSSFDTSNVSDMYYMFSGCSDLANLDLSSFDTSNVTNMGEMFSGCSSLTNLNLSNFGTGNVVEMVAMFKNCSNLVSLDISNFDTTNLSPLLGVVRDIFDECYSLQTLHTPKVITRNISLPGTFFDPNGRQTNALNAAFASTILTKAAAIQPAPTTPPGLTQQPQPIVPDGYQPSAYYTGWCRINGLDYWYEHGVKQGTEGRGKEIYDPGTDAWYWLDAVSGGAKATDKDVYQDSNGGKWVRYDANGHMVKGEDYRDGAWYYFEPITGAMVKGPMTLSDGRRVFYSTENGQMLKGNYTINNQRYRFDEKDGDLRRGQYDKFWVQIDGKDYWYENWQRQGWNPALPSYRGKEIYDPVTNAWYWLDNLYQGAKAAGKDVYQESRSAYPDRLDGTGKWVRYDIHGRMVKGWHYTPAGTWYFEPVTGSMAKGRVTIDGNEYYFDEVTGVRR